MGKFIRPYFAGKVFGERIVNAGVKKISDELLRWGYTNHQTAHHVPRARAKAASRLRRRWAKISPTSAIPLGDLRRRYHANLVRYLLNRDAFRAVDAYCVVTFIERWER
jgi:hypothetical protein